MSEPTQKSLIKTRRIQLLPLTDFKETYQYIRGLSSDITMLSNEIVRRHISTFYELDDIRERNKDLKKSDAQTEFKNKYGMSLQNMGYDISKKYSEIPSSIRGSVNQKLYKLLEKSFFEIKIGKISIPSFTKNKMAIPFQYKDNIKINEFGIYTFRFFNDKVFSLHFGRDKSNNKIIIDRILNGEYAACDSQIEIKNNKIFLLLTFKFEPEKINLDYTKILGIDLGINRPVSLAREDGAYVPQINIGGKIELTRASIRKQRYSLNKALKHSTGGHGRTKKISKIEHLKDIEKNFMKTTNDTISRGVIKYCLENGVGIIKMENLTGITKDVNNTFLKSWAFYQLQSMIEYKAKEYNIQIVFVDPAYTSQTCSTCGNVDKEQREKTKFLCLNNQCKEFGVEKDADINAALNISRLGGVETRKEATKIKKRKEKLQVIN